MLRADNFCVWALAVPRILRTGPAISERYPFGQSNIASGKSKPRTQCLSPSARLSWRV